MQVTIDKIFNRLTRYRDYLSNRADDFHRRRARTTGPGQSQGYGVDPVHQVVGEDGQPIFGARVNALMRRGDSFNGSTVATNVDGSCKIENLEDAPYTISAYAPGYFDASYLEYERHALLVWIATPALPAG